MGIKDEKALGMALDFMRQGLGIVSQRMAVDRQQDAMKSEADEALYQSQKQAGEERQAAARETSALREKQQRNRARRMAAMGKSGTSLNGSAMNALAASGAQDLMDSEDILSEGQKRADDALSLGRLRAKAPKRRAKYAGMQADQEMVGSFLNMGSNFFSGL